MIRDICVTEPILYCVKSGDEVKVKMDYNSGFPIVSINGLDVIRFTSEGEHCRGMRSNLIIYEDGVDKKNVDEVLIPLTIDAYAGDELIEPVIIKRKNFESRFSNDGK